MPIVRGLHYFGTGTAVFLAAAALITRNPYLAPFVLLVGYGSAWVAHFFIERNRPAAFQYPLWSFMADFKMLTYFLTGKIGPEVERLYGSRAPAPDAPLRVRI